MVALDFLERDPFLGQQTGREGLKAAILMIRAAFPDLEWVVDEMVAEGEAVASHFTWRGTHREAFLGVPATGKRITVTGMVFDRVVEGQLVESQILMNTLALLTQLGPLRCPHSHLPKPFPGSGLNWKVRCSKGGGAEQEKERR
ncbi:hypothetical protein KSB_87860 [Ktedonobacter robiniae]|uniref:Ester cyclase n=1 Tax=Ktedonobacter robiniae TaxID=2778365 RepID=A0ABQ3V554_9CHLR|nr:hypothetical protein KSB_87860 [Ktedonobacter robiniae]